MAMDFSIFKFGSASLAAEPTPVLKRAADTGRDFDSMLSTERASERASANKEESNRSDAAEKSRSESVFSGSRPVRPARPELENDTPYNEAATAGRDDLAAREAGERVAQAGQTVPIENSRRAEHAADNKRETDTDTENGRYEETHKLIDDEYGNSGTAGTEGSKEAQGPVLSSSTVPTGFFKRVLGGGAQELVETITGTAPGVEKMRVQFGALPAIDTKGGTTEELAGGTVASEEGALIDALYGADTEDGTTEEMAESTEAESSAREAVAGSESSSDGVGAHNGVGIASLLLGNAHGDGATEALWTAIESNVGTDTRLFALSDHFETLPGAFETSETLSATIVERPEAGESNEASPKIGSGIEPGKSQAFSQLEAEELAFRIGLGANGVDGIGTAKLPDGSSATTEEGSEAVAATGSVTTETEIFVTDGDDVTATLTTVLPDDLPDDLSGDLTENLIDVSGDDPVVSTPGLGAQFAHSFETLEAGKQHAPAHGAVGKAPVSLSGETGTGEIGRAAAGTTGNEAASSEAEAGEADTAASGAENAEDGENKGAEQSRAGSSDRGALRGLENAVERLRENRTAADANGIKRLIEQAEAGAEVDGNGNEASTKSAEAQQNGLKGEGNGTGTGFGKGAAGLFYGSSYGGGSGSDGNGQPGKGNGRPATPQDYAALIGRDGELRSMSFTETVRAATTGASAAEGVENTLKVYEKFAQAIKLSFLGGGKQVNLRLSPAHLGNLQIKLTGDGSNVTARIIVDSVAVKNLLEGDAGKLKELFNQQGLNMEEYTVEVRERSIGANDSGGADLWERYADKGASGKDRDRAVVVPVESAVIKASMNAAYGLGANRGVDLFA
jgi:hypothetical protein